MKLFVLPPNESWIADRQVQEYVSAHPASCVSDPAGADIIWLFSDWCWKQIPLELLQKKTVVTTIHHIVPSKLDRDDFAERDKITNVYHVPNFRTQAQVEMLTCKSVRMIPYWANAELWKPIPKTKEQIRTELLGIPANVFLVGSFQRDSEGSDTSKPKLEKGPDLFADACVQWNKQHDNFHVLLSGWRRDYVCHRLREAKVPFTYIEMPDQTTLKAYYQALDLYAVTSRYEGGPQAFIECALLHVPMVSTPAGMAEQVLPRTAINKNVTHAAAQIPFAFTQGFEDYDMLFKELMK